MPPTDCPSRPRPLRPPPPLPPGGGAGELTLRVFVALAESPSLQAAAARLGISLSGLSQQITALEPAVGARLFDRRARPVTLPPAGQALRGHARRILSVVSEAQADLTAFHLASLPRLNPTFAVIPKSKSFW